MQKGSVGVLYSNFCPIPCGVYLIDIQLHQSYSCFISKRFLMKKLMLQAHKSSTHGQETSRGPANCYPIEVKSHNVEKNSMNRKNIYWGIFFIALSTLFWEILLTRIFSATMYYHFVFLSISLAMLGFGCSGVVVFLFPNYFAQERCNDQLTLYSSLFSVSIFAAILVFLQVNLSLHASLGRFYA